VVPPCNNTGLDGAPSTVSCSGAGPSPDPPERMGWVGGGGAGAGRGSPSGGEAGPAPTADGEESGVRRVDARAVESGGERGEAEEGAASVAKPTWGGEEHDTMG
jgi:hypothetical protein